jgi:hypothetical protein
VRGHRDALWLGADAAVKARLAREIRLDPDVWIVETEDRAGRNFLDAALTR